jgi:hypothetical protein
MALLIFPCWDTREKATGKRRGLGHLFFCLLLLHSVHSARTLPPSRAVNSSFHLLSFLVFHRTPEAGNIHPQRRESSSTGLFFQDVEAANFPSLENQGPSHFSGFLASDNPNHFSLFSPRVAACCHIFIICYLISPILKIYLPSKNFHLFICFEIGSPYVALNLPIQHWTPKPPNSASQVLAL